MTLEQWEKSKRDKAKKNIVWRDTTMASMTPERTMELLPKREERVEICKRGKYDSGAACAGSQEDGVRAVWGLHPSSNFHNTSQKQYKEDPPDT